MPSIRILADRSRGERLKWRDKSGVEHLINPETGKREPWPALGLVFQDDTPSHRPIDPPAVIKIPTKKIDALLEQKLVALVGERIATAPSGPPSNPSKTSHTFRQADEILFLCCDKQGQKTAARYKVTHNPGKYPEGPTTRVDWFYELELIGVEPAAALIGK